MHSVCLCLNLLIYCSPLHKRKCELEFVDTVSDDGFKVEACELVLEKVKRCEEDDKLFQQSDVAQIFINGPC